MTGIEEVGKDFETTMNGLLSRAKSFKGAAARIYKLYQKFQTERFQTQNASEGGEWEQLTDVYKKSKLKRFQTYPGNGTKMLIATGTLAGSVIGPGAPFATEGISAHRAIFTDTYMQISIDTSGSNAQGKKFDYPKYVNEKRPFMKFSQNHIDQMKTLLQKYVVGE